MWVCSPKVTPIVLDHYNKKFDLPNVSLKAQAKVVGKIIKKSRYTVYANKKKIVDGPIKKINEGFVYRRPLKSIKVAKKENSLPPIKNYNDVVMALLKNENIASRVPVYECYDKNVQGRVVLERSTSEAGVVAAFGSGFPEEIRSVGFSAALAHNPKIGEGNPYLTAQHAVLEATAKVVASGSIPVALTDCLCFGNPEKPEQMWQFAESCRGIKEACSKLCFEHSAGLPIVAGNVSFYNQSGKKAIPPSPIIGCFGKTNNVNMSIKNSLQNKESVLLLLGGFGNKVGGSVVADLFEVENNDVCDFSVTEYNKMLNALTKLVSKKMVLSSRVVTRGGLVVALAKMSFMNEVGFLSTVSKGSFSEKIFNESLSVVVQVGNKHLGEAQKTLERNNIPFDIIGITTPEKRIKINNKISLLIKDAKNVWENSLRKKLLS